MSDLGRTSLEEQPVLADASAESGDLTNAEGSKVGGALTVWNYFCDGSLVDISKVLGIGSTGLVLRHGAYVLKAPLLTWYPDAELTDQEYHELMHGNKCSYSHLQVEKTAYTRLQDGKGIAKCIEIIENGIVLEYYPGGDLQQFLEQNDEDDSKKTPFIFGMIDALVSCHHLRVLNSDIALRNFILASDQSIRMIDFSHAEVLPMETRMSTTVNFGGTVNADIFSLACAIYSVSTWQKYERNGYLGKDALPSIHDMPSTEHVMYGHVIKRCWQGQYNTVYRMRWAMRAERLRLGLVDVWKHCLRIVQHMF